MPKLWWWGGGVGGGGECWGGGGGVGWVGWVGVGWWVWRQTLQHEPNLPWSRQIPVAYGGTHSRQKKGADVWLWGVPDLTSKNYRRLEEHVPP